MERCIKTTYCPTLSGVPILSIEGGWRAVVPLRRGKPSHLEDEVGPIYGVNWRRTARHETTPFKEEVRVDALTPLLQTSPQDEEGQTRPLYPMGKS